MALETYRGRRDFTATDGPDDIAAGTPAGRKRPPAGKARTGGDEVPAFVPRALATLGPRPPAGSGWVHGIRFDGHRTRPPARPRRKHPRRGGPACA